MICDITRLILPTMIGFLLLIVTAKTGSSERSISSRNRLNVRCYYCAWYPNANLPSVRNSNSTEICRPHGFRLPMLVETCRFGCVISSLYLDADEQRRRRGRRISGVPVSLRWERNETMNLTVQLPPMVYYKRGCAESYNTGCFMDMSRPGVYHQDCFCHDHYCNGEVLHSFAYLQRFQLSPVVTVNVFLFLPLLLNF